MADQEHIKEFPAIDHKLAAPKKLSAFEKERQAAEAKRLRAEAENAAALREFEDAFADEDDDPLAAAVGRRGPPSGPRGAGAYGGGYGMPPSGPRSGPGSLGPGPGMAPPSLKRKRALDEMREAQEARREQAMLYDEGRSDRRHTPQAAMHDDDREDMAPRPTVSLSSLPPNTTTSMVESLLEMHLSVHSVQFQPPAGPGTAGKRSLSAIATLSSETSTSQIDAAVTALKDKYLGYGFYLSISRHLSSAAVHPTMAATMTTQSTEPFGAEKPKEARQSLRNAPPPREHGGFAPPDHYNSSSGMSAPPEALVNVHAPIDIATVRAIHTLVERLMTEPSPQRALKMEAFLMSLPEVRNDERFAFLYDSRSPAGLYYRYVLWGPADPSEQKKRYKGLERVHDDMVFEWAPPYDEVPFMNLASLSEVVTDMDYISSDEESDDEDAERRFNDGRDGNAPLPEANETKRLSPVKRARFVHLLSRLPPANARLRKGDVARITNFAINHAGGGAEEIVDLLLLNIEKPFSSSLAAKYEDLNSEEEEEYEPDEALPTLNTDSPKPLNGSNKRDQDDPSSSKMIGLYIISDILSASSTAGANSAWKYRSLFEAGFRAQKTFEHLGRLDKELAWGRLKAEQWKRKVGVIFGIWEGWSVFSSDVHEELRQSFLEPPLSEKEKMAEQAKVEEEERKRKERQVLGKFRRVDQAASASGSASPAPAAAPSAAAEDVDGAPMDEVDGVPMSEDVDGAPMDDLDGAPMEDLDGGPMTDDVDGMPMSVDEATDEKTPIKADTSAPPSAPASSSAPKPSGPKRRMRAEDMFASDED